MDQDEAFRRVWQTFRTFPRLADGRHDDADWRSHDGDYAVCVVRIPVSAIAAPLAACRATLAAHPYVRLHPDGFLHLTLQELGFVCDDPARPDEITPGRLEELATAAAGALASRPPFRIDLGGINSFQDAAFLDVHDDGSCGRLHARLFELTAIARAPRYAFLPHVTVAHYTAAVPNHGLAASLTPWRDVRFGSLLVPAVEIVTLRVDEPYPPLEPYALIPLSG